MFSYLFRADCNLSDTCREDSGARSFSLCAPCLLCCHALSTVTLQQPAPLRTVHHPGQLWGHPLARQDPVSDPKACDLAACNFFTKWQDLAFYKRPPSLGLPLSLCVPLSLAPEPLCVPLVCGTMLKLILLALRLI